MDDIPKPDKRSETPKNKQLGLPGNSSPPEIVITPSSTPPPPQRRRSSEISPKTLQAPGPSPPRAQWLQDKIRRGSRFEPSKDDFIEPLSFGRRNNPKTLEEKLEAASNTPFEVPDNPSVAPLSFGRRNNTKTLELEAANNTAFEVPEDPSVAPLSFGRRSSPERFLDKLLNKFPKPPSSPPKDSVEDSPNTITKKLSKFLFPKRSNSQAKFGPLIAKIEDMVDGKDTSPTPSPPGSPIKTPMGPPPTPPMSSGPPQTPARASGAILPTPPETPGTIGGSTPAGPSPSRAKVSDSESQRTTPSHTLSDDSDEVIEDITQNPDFNIENLSDVESDKSNNDEGSNTPPRPNDDTAGGLFGGRNRNQTKPLAGKETIDILKNEKESRARRLSDNARFLAKLNAAAAKKAGGSGGPPPPPARNSKDNSLGWNGSGNDSDDNNEPSKDKGKGPEEPKKDNSSNSDDESTDDENLQQPNFPGKKLPPGGKPGGPPTTIPPPLNPDILAFRKAAQDLGNDSESSGIIELANKAVDAALNVSKDDSFENIEKIDSLTKVNVAFQRAIDSLSKDLAAKRNDKQYSRADVEFYIERINELEKLEVEVDAIRAEASRKISPEVCDQQKTELKSKVATLEDSERNQASTIAKLEGDNKVLQTENLNLTQAAATNKQEKDSLQNENDDLKAELEKLKEEANGKIPQEQCEEEKAELKRQLKAARSAISRRDQAIASLQLERDALKSRILEFNSAEKVRDLIQETHQAQITAFEAEIAELEGRLRNSQYADDAEENAIEARIQELKDFIEALEDTYLITNKDCEDRTEEIAANLKREIDGLHKHNAELEAGSFAGNNSIMKFTKQIANLEAQLKMANEKTLTAAECDVQKAVLAGKIKALKQEIVDLNEKLNTLEFEKTSLEEQNTEIKFESDIQVGSLAAEIEKLEQEIIDLKEQLSTVEAEKTSLQEGSSREKADRDARIVSLTAQTEKLEQDLAALQVQIQTADSDKNSAQENSEKAKVSLQAEIDSLKQSLVEAGLKTLTEDECTSKHSAEIADLKAQIKQLEDYMLEMVSRDDAMADVKRWQDENKELGDEIEQLKNNLAALKPTPGVKTLTDAECADKYQEDWDKQEIKLMKVADELDLQLQDARDALDNQRVAYTSELAALALQFEEEAKASGDGKITLNACTLANKAHNDKLEAEIAKLQRDLDETIAAHDDVEARLKRYTSLDAAQMKSLRAQIASLEAELEIAQENVSNPADFDGLLTEEECADKNKTETEKLRAEITKLKQQLGAARQVPNDSDDNKTLRQRVAELDSELEKFKKQVKDQADALKARGFSLNERNDLEECNEEVNRLKEMIKKMNEGSGGLPERIAELEKEIQRLRDACTQYGKNDAFMQRMFAQANERLQLSQQREVNTQAALDGANDGIDILKQANTILVQQYELAFTASAQKEEDLLEQEHEFGNAIAEFDRQVKEQTDRNKQLAQDLADLAVMDGDEQLRLIAGRYQAALDRITALENRLKDEKENKIDRIQEIKKLTKALAKAKDENEDAFHELGDQISQKEGMIADAMASADRTEAAINEKKKEVAILEATIKDLETQLAAAKTASDGSLSSNGDGEALEACNAECDQLRTEISDLRKRLAASPEPQDTKPLEDCNDEVKRLNLEIEGLVRKLQDAEKDVNDLEAKDASNKFALDNWPKLIDELTAKVAALEAQLTTAKEALAALQIEKAALEKQLQDAKEDQQIKQTSLDKRIQESASQETKIINLTTKISTLESYISTIDTDALEACNEEVARLQSILDEQSSSDDSLFRSLKAEIGGPDLQAVIAGLRSELADAERALASSPSEDLSKAKDEIARLQLHVAELSEFEGQVVGLKNHIDVLSNQIVRLQKEIKRLSLEEQRLVTAQNQVQTLSSEISQLQTELAAAKAETGGATNDAALQDCNETVTRLSSELATANADIQNLVSRVYALENDDMVLALQQQITTLRSELEAEKRNTSGTSADAKALQQCASEVSRLEAELAAAQANASGSADDSALSQCKSEVEELRGKLAKLTRELQAANARADDLNTLIEGLQTTIANKSSDSDIKKLKDEIRRLKSENSILVEDEDTLIRAQIEIDRLKELLGNLNAPAESQAAVLKTCSEEVELLRFQITALNKEISDLQKRASSPEPVADGEIDRLQALAVREKRRFEEQKRQLEAFRDQMRRTDALTREHQRLLLDAGIPFPMLGADGTFPSPFFSQKAKEMKKTNEIKTDEPEPLQNPPPVAERDPDTPVYSIQEIELAILRARTDLNYIIALRARTGFVENDLQTAIQAITIALEMVTSFSPYETDEEILQLTASANFWNFLILYYSDDHVAAAEALREADRYRANLEEEEEREAVSEWVAYATLPPTARTRQAYGGGRRKARTESGGSAGSGLSVKTVKKPKKGKGKKDKGKGKEKAVDSDEENRDAKKEEGKKDKKVKKPKKEKKEKEPEEEKEEKLPSDADLGFGVAGPSTATI
ncbi:hypothetical protein BDZ45DRAFT_726760 [Acephala macrosclerotiorum]|nr:hypothetical protein BDZ45DRAFT_726760 [Acephala macrosclerotiorum]